MSLFEEYRQELIYSLNNFDESDIIAIKDKIIKAGQDRKTVFIIGNGGSASTASHFACDLGKGCAVKGASSFKVLSLTDNVPWMTAVSNDLSYDDVFLHQLGNFAEQDDLLIAISASGNSPNIIKACEFAREKGLYIIAFVGFDGGKLKEIADTSIWVKSNNYGIVEDCHLVLEHMITFLIIKEFPAKTKSHVEQLMASQEVCTLPAKVDKDE